MSLRSAFGPKSLVAAALLVLTAAVGGWLAVGPQEAQAQRQVFDLDLSPAPGTRVSEPPDENFGTCMSMDGAEMLVRPMSMQPYAQVAFSGSPEQASAFTGCMDRVGVRYSPA